MTFIVKLSIQNVIDYKYKVLNLEEKWLNVIYKPPRRSRVVYIE